MCVGVFLSHLDHISEDEEENELNRTYSLETENELKSQLDSIKTSTITTTATSSPNNNENNSLHEQFVRIRSNTHDIIKPNKNGIFVTLNIKIDILIYIYLYI